jgi:hypothetical protein
LTRRFESTSYLRSVRKRASEIVRSGNSQELRNLCDSVYDVEYPESVRKAVLEVLLLNGVSLVLQKEAGTEMVFPKEKKTTLSREEKINRIKANLMGKIDKICEDEDEDEIGD